MSQNKIQKNQDDIQNQSTYQQLQQLISSLPETEILTYKSIIPQYLEDYGIKTPEQYIEFLDYIYTHLPKHRLETGVKVHKHKLQKEKLDKISYKRFGFNSLEEYLESIHGDRYRKKAEEEQKYEEKLKKQDEKRKKEQLL